MSQGFITPEEVEVRESWCGRACLEALVGFDGVKVSGTLLDRCVPDG